MSNYETYLTLGVAIQLASFFLLMLFGPRLGKPWAGWVAVAAMASACGLATITLVGWMGEIENGTAAALTAAAAHNQFHWADIGKMPVNIGVKLDSLTVIMYFMVTFIATWIFVFSVGYMAGHSDEVAGKSKFHRFFCYLSLFAFSMLGLVISSNLLFLFIFWELVGLCSYLLIGFYFDKKFASDAAMKAFITNRVGDFGFIFGLMMVFFFLGTLDLDGAARVFADQFHSQAGIFGREYDINLLGWHVSSVSGTTLATMMGIGLFCGAMGKSAQFPLQVWLPDAMAGPTPVSALIHAATMVAAGVYLVARVFRLLTPEAQMFIAAVGCITLTAMALIAIVQTDIKKCLAYSTLSQLGYMVFAMGCGAWIAALFHLMTHAFFKAMMFLGSGQVIEGCHHEQDMRKMGGLMRKMPVTGFTFLIGVLAISGFGIPKTDIGLGGFFSKDEILAVAWDRAYMWDEPIEDHGGHHADIASASAFQLVSFSPDQEHGDHGGGHDEGRDTHTESAGEHGDAHAAHGPVIEQPHGKAAIMAGVSALPRWMFWCALITAYVTPFYMMRCWWLTFMGKPRDQHVHDHAHESPMMWFPLVVLAVFTFVCSYAIFRPLIADAAVVASDAVMVVGLDGVAVPSNDPVARSEAAGAFIHLHEAHDFLAYAVGGSWLISFIVAFLIYRNGLEVGAKLKSAFGPIATLLERKYYFDEIYGFFLVMGCRAVAQVCRAFDTYFVDMLANLSAKITERFAAFSGRAVDAYVVDGVFNGIAATSMDVSDVFRSPQTGRIRNYVLFATGGAAIVILVLLFIDGSSGPGVVLGASGGG